MSLSPRKSLAWARCSQRVGDMTLAAQLTITNGIDDNDSDVKFIADVIRNVVGR